MLQEGHPSALTIGFLCLNSGDDKMYAPRIYRNKLDYRYKVFKSVYKQGDGVIAVITMREIAFYC